MTPCVISLPSARAARRVSGNTQTTHRFVLLLFVSISVVFVDFSRALFLPGPDYFPKHSLTPPRRHSVCEGWIRAGARRALPGAAADTRQQRGGARPACNSAGGRTTMARSAGRHGGGSAWSGSSSRNTTRRPSRTLTKQRQARRFLIDLTCVFFENCRDFQGYQHFQ